MSVDFLPKNFPPFQVHHAKKPPRFYPDGFQRNVIDFYFIFSDCRLRKALYLQFSYFIWPLVPSAPKFSVPVLVFQLAELLIQHRTAFPFQIPHKVRHRDLRRYLHKQMDMVGARFRFYDPYPFPLAQLPQYLPYCRFLFFVKYFPTVLWRKHDMIFAIPSRMR